jgi:hypothetical protein
LTSSAEKGSKPRRVSKVENILSPKVEKQKWILENHSKAKIVVHASEDKESLSGAAEENILEWENWWHRVGKDR